MGRDEGAPSRPGSQPGRSPPGTPHASTPRRAALDGTPGQRLASVLNGTPLSRGPHSGVPGTKLARPIRATERHELASALPGVDSILGTACASARAHARAHNKRAMPRSPFSSSTPTPTTLMTCTQPTPSTAASIGVRCDSALDDASPLAASVHAAGAPRAPPTVHDGDDGSARAHGAPSDADVARMKAKRRKALFDS